MSNPVTDAIAKMIAMNAEYKQHILGDLPPLGFKPVDDATTFEYGVRYLVLLQQPGTGDFEIVMFHPSAGNDFDLADFPDGILTLADVRAALYISHDQGIAGFMKQQDLLDLFLPQQRKRPISPRLTMLVKVSNDIDAVPGWGDNAKDWVNLLSSSGYGNQTHYNTEVVVIGADVT